LNYRRILQIAVLTFVLTAITASPVMAQVNIPYTTNIITDSGKTAVNVGVFSVGTDGTVTFQIDEAGTNLRLSDTQLYVGDTPPVKVKPDKFPYKHAGLGGAASDAYIIDLVAADINIDGIIYIAAHVDLITPTGAALNHGKSNVASDTAWAQGDELTGNGKNQIIYFSVQRGPRG